MWLTQRRYCHKDKRSFHKKRKNCPVVIVSLGMPEYVSIRHRR